MKVGKSTGIALALSVGFLVLVAVVAGAMLFGGGGTLGQVTDGTGAVGQIETGEKALITVDTTTKYTLFFGTPNYENKTGTEYLAYTARIYVLNADGSETFSGTAIAMSSTALSNWTSAEYGKNYKVYFPATSGTRVSGYVVTGPIKSDTTVSLIDIASPKDASSNTPEIANSKQQFTQHAAAVFKAYDENNRGYLYGSTDTTAGTLRLTGVTHYSTTANATGPTIGAGDNIKYTIEVSTNGTAATDTRISDREVLACIDNGNGTTWQEPTSVTLEGGVVTKKTNYPAKIGSDLYDFCYSLYDTQGNNIKIGSAVKKLTFQEYPVSGQNPMTADDITWGFFTSGFYKHNLDENMELAFVQDDASRTYVYTVQTIIFEVV